MKGINLSSVMLALKRLAHIAYQLTQVEPTIEINGSKITFKANAALHIETTYLVASYTKGWLGSVPVVLEITEDEEAKLVKEVHKMREFTSPLSILQEQGCPTHCKETR